jgi:hypothetical protein
MLLSLSLFWSRSFGGEAIYCNYIISYYCIRTKKRKTEKEKESIVEKEEKKSSDVLFLTHTIIMIIIHTLFIHLP